MSFEARDLADTIVLNVRAGTLSAAAGAKALSVGYDFCSVWPKANPVLEFLAGIVIFIPGAGTTAGAVLQGLLKVGDQVATQTCH